MTTPDNYIPNAGAGSALAAWLAGDLAGAVAHLYVNNVPFAPTNTPGSYLEASFPGYAQAGPLTWGAPFLNLQGKEEVDSNQFGFHLSSFSGSYTVYGTYITDSTGAKLLIVIPLAEPYMFTPDQPNLFQTVMLTAVSEL